MKLKKNFSSILKNQNGYAAFAITFVIAAVALTLASSLQNQVQLFTKGLVRARTLSEAQFAIEAFAVKIRDAYIQARPVPEAVVPTATYKQDANAARFRAVRSTGNTTEIKIYNVDDKFCFERPLNKSYLTADICIAIPEDFLARRKDEESSLKMYATFFMHQVQELITVPSAVANFGPSDPGFANLSAVNITVNRNFMDGNFNYDYIEQRCGGGSPNPDVDCFRFRFCLARFKSDCASGAGNEKFVVQTIVLRKTPETSMGY